MASGGAEVRGSNRFDFFWQARVVSLPEMLEAGSDDGRDGADSR